MRERWGLISILAGLVALTGIWGALVLLPAQAEFGLSTVSGNLQFCDQGFCLDGGPVYFGPEWFLNETHSTVDYDGDGTTGSLFEELNGLVGHPALAEVHRNGDAPEVYVLNGSPWRGIAEEPPWRESGSNPRLDGTTAPTVAATAMSVTLEGILESCGSGWCLEGQKLYLGPFWYLSHRKAVSDFDGDGATESPADELDGLVGSGLVVEGRVDGGEFEVFAIDGVRWRPVDGPPPWSGGPSVAAPAAEREEPGAELPSEETEKASGKPAETEEHDGEAVTLPEPADHDQPPAPEKPGPPGGAPPDEEP